MSIWAGQILTPPLTGDGRIFRQASGEVHSPSKKHLTSISEYDFTQSNPSISNDTIITNGNTPTILHDIHKSITKKNEKDNALSFFKNLILHRSNRNAERKSIDNDRTGSSVSCVILENFNTETPIVKRKAITTVTTAPTINPNNNNHNHEINGFNNSDKNNTSNINIVSSKQIVCGSSEKRGENVIISGVNCDKIDCDIDKINGRDGGGDGDKSKGVFILPRVNLKANLIPMCNDESSTFQQCFIKSGGRERVSSHYSTDKSGSSGYYSSNVYSTSSLEDHIYSEPVSDALDHHQHSQRHLHTQQLTAQSTGVKMCIENDKTINRPQMVNQKHGMINLEKSIRDLEMHLQLFNRPIYNSNTSNHNNNSCISSAIPFDGYYDEECIDRSDRRRSDRLPTIMEGIDGPSTTNNWQEDPDDSLMDLDLDSFLLANEMAVTEKRNGNKDIDNPKLENDGNSTGTSKIMENNYKCTKYVNSCPDNPYQLDGIIEDTQPSIDKSLAFYLKKCEDQVHYQSTKDILEDIREKLNALLINNNNNNEYGSTKKASTKITTTPTTTTMNPFVDAVHNNSTEIKPNIEADITSLRQDVDNYIGLMNTTNEAEFKDFYEGLSKNNKLQSVQNAFVNKARSSRYSDDTIDTFKVSSNDERNYEPILTISGKTQYTDLEANSQFETMYVQDGYRLDTESDMSYNASTPRPKFLDPNFRLERKIIDTSACSSCESMIRANNGIRTSGSENSSDDRTSDEMTQLQQNITLQQQVVLSNGFRQSMSDKDAMLEWHRNKPSIWEMYYGTNRAKQTIFSKRRDFRGNNSMMSYPSSRPESDFTLDLPRAEQLRIKMKKEKQFRHRCRIITTFFSLVFFLLTVMVVSLILTRGKRMFGSMI